MRRDDRDRPGIDPALFTTDAEALVTREDVDLVIEVIGGIEPARSLILGALRHGASVVTANKTLLAADGATLFEAAEQAGADLYFEAAVAGAIPIIRPLRESLVGDEITSVIGIVNGTTNYILDRMDTAGIGFAEALAEAQQRGYAEADPTADVEGFDAAAKAAILASLAFHTRVTGADVYREGITGITSADIASAHEIGCVVKLLAICELSPRVVGAVDRTVSVRVHPAMIPRSTRWPRSATRTTRCSWSRCLPAGSCSTVLVPAGHRRRVQFSGTLSLWPGTGCVGPWALVSPATRHVPLAKSAR